MTVPESVPTRPRSEWAWRGGPTFTVPDGSRVRLEQPRLDPSQPWSAAFAVRTGGDRFGLTVTEIGAFDWHVTYQMAGAEVTSVAYAGGDLLLASRREPADYRAAWRGRWFELHHRPAVPVGAGVPRVFDALRFTDTPEGMLVRPRGAVSFEPYRLAKQLPGLGQLRIERPDRASVAVPRFRGHRTPFGEIWRRPLGEAAHGRARDEALLLAAPTAVAQLIPGPRDTPDEDVALAFLEQLAVIWEPS